MALHSALRKRPGCMMWTHVLLLVLLLALSVGTVAAATADQGNKTANASAPSAAGGRAPSPVPISKKLAGAAARWWGPFASAADAGWVIAAFLECVGLGAYYVWGTGPQPQQPPPLQPAQDDGGGGGLLSQWLETLWAQHWPDVQQHLPPPWGYLLVQWQVHGRRASCVVAVAGAVTVVGSGGWMLYQEQQRIAAMPGCWPHMLTAVRGDDDGRGSWWTLPWRARAFWQAASTGPCSGRQHRVTLYSVALVRRLYAALQTVLRTALRGGRSILEFGLSLGHGEVRAADVVAWVEDRARAALVWMEERSRWAVVWVGEWVQRARVWGEDRGRWALSWMEDRVQRALEWVESVSDSIVDAALALAEETTARAADVAAWGKEQATGALGWLVRTRTFITIVLLVLHLFGALWWYRDLVLEEIQRRSLQVGWPGAGMWERREAVAPSGVRSEGIDIKAPPPVPLAPPEEQEDEAAAAFGRMQRFVHQLLTTLGQAHTAQRARHAVAIYDACQRLLESVYRLERRRDLSFEQVQRPWLETMWEWFDLLLAGLHDWVEHGGGRHPATERLEAEAQTDPRAQLIRTYARLARMGQSRWLSPRPGSQPMHAEQQHWEETWALRALLDPVRRRYLADCGPHRQRTLSQALVHMLRQPLPAPTPRLRVIHRTKVLRLRGYRAGEVDEEDEPVVRPQGNPRVILLRARVIPASPKHPNGGLAPSPRISLILPFLAVADREAVAAAVLGPIRWREQQRLLAPPLPPERTAAASHVELAVLGRLLVAVEREGAGMLQSLLFDEDPEGVMSGATGEGKRRIEQEEEQQEAGAPSLAPSHALELIVELRGTAPPFARWCRFEGRRMVAERSRKYKAAAAAGVSHPSASALSLPRTTAMGTGKRASVVARLIEQEHAAAEEEKDDEEGEEPPPVVARPPFPPPGHPHVTWADPLAEMEMAALLPGESGSSIGSTSTSSTSSSTTDAAPVAPPRGSRRPRRRVLQAAALTVLAVGLIVLAAWLWKGWRPPAHPTPPLPEAPTAKPQAPEAPLTQPLPEPVVEQPQAPEEGGRPRRRWLFLSPSGTVRVMPEPPHEKPVGGGGEGGGGLTLLERREPLTYAEWQQGARSMWEKKGSYEARVGRRGQTLAELLAAMASAQERVVIEAIAAFDPTWHPGRDVRFTPEFRQYHAQWAEVVAKRGTKNKKTM